MCFFLRASSGVQLIKNTKQVQTMGNVLIHCYRVSVCVDSCGEKSRKVSLLIDFFFLAASQTGHHLQLYFVCACPRVPPASSSNLSIPFIPIITMTFLALFNLAIFPKHPRYTFHSDVRILDPILVLIRAKQMHHIQ